MLNRRFVFTLPSLFLTLSSSWFSAVVVVRAQDDYLTEVPPTVYESDEMSPQTIDYDKANKRFPAHAGWYNDRLIHYYKFRIFAPPTYPNVITDASTSLDVPIQKLYIPTTDGTLQGAVGNPIAQYHHVDGVLYSDFAEIVLVPVTSDYGADTYKSEGDVMAAMQASSITPVETGILLNLPIVPTNSTLQDPENLDGGVAPIDPVVVWYKGLRIWTYVFEVTDASAAEYFASSRPDDPSDPNYAVAVVPNFAASSGVQAIPLFFLNPYTVGVDETNFGGPDSAGMRNILNLDRTDEGYSPLWQLLWLTALPINYQPDQASNVNTLTPANGFEITPTPIFVNCPTMGTMANSDNPMKLDKFETSIVVPKDEGSDMNATFWVMGGAGPLILMPDVTVDLVANGPATATSRASGSGDGQAIASTQTIPSGSYQYQLEASEIPMGATSVNVVLNGTVIRTIAVEMSDDSGSDGGDTSMNGSGGGTSAAGPGHYSGGVFGAAAIATITAGMATLASWN